MLLFDYQCEECGQIFERIVEYEDRDNQKCDYCNGRCYRIWLKAPNQSLLGQEGSDTSIKAMKQSFRERFIKKEMDDCIHRHGDAFVDSIRGAAVQRIKENKTDEVTV